MLNTEINAYKFLIQDSLMIKTGTVGGRIKLNKQGWKFWIKFILLMRGTSGRFCEESNETTGSIIFGKFIVKLRQTRLCCMRLSQVDTA